MITKSMIKAASPFCDDQNNPVETAMTSSSADKSDTRLREAHHRIANNLALIASFVRLQSSKVGREKRALSAAEVCVLLEEVGARIETVGHLHHLLGARSDSAQVDVSEYLESVCDVLSQSICASRRMELRCEADAGAIEPGNAGLLGLIVTELVTNAVKYAHPTGVAGVIKVSCRRSSEGELVLSVSDDGVGLPEDFDPKTDGGLGMRVVRSLVNQLGAGLEFEGSDLGLTIRVTTPAVAARAAPALKVVN